MPELQDQIGKNNNEDIVMSVYDNGNAENVFGINWRSMDDAIEDTTESLLALEAKA